MPPRAPALNLETARMGSIGVFAMTKLIKRFLRDERGAAAAEYALILAVVGGGIAAAAIVLGTNISTVINGIAGLIKLPAAG